MLEYTKTIERDTTLIMEYPFSKVMLNFKLQKPVYFHLTNDKNVVFYENLENRNKLNAFLEKKLKESLFIQKVEQDYYSSIEEIRDFWKKRKASSIEELKKFVLLSQKPIFSVTVCYFAGELNVSKEIEEKIIKLRSTDNFFAESDKFVRNSLISFGVNSKFTNIIALEELDNLPSNKELKKRTLTSVGLVDGEFFKLKKGESIQDHFPKFKFIHSIKGYEVKGKTAFKGKVIGIVCHVRNKEDMKKVNNKSVIVTSMTTPDLLPAMRKAAAFVTDEGGITSHAAIVSREMKKPCIIGTKVATQILKDGMKVEVDANKGIVKILKNEK